MNIKVYSQNNCLYCKKVKDKLDEFHVKYEEIDINLEENRDEWNGIVKISGLPMTPTITIDEEIWAPNRDFRNPEELANRLKEVEKAGGLDPIKKEEEFQVLLNGLKNLGVGMRNLQNQINQLNMKLNPQPQNPKPQNPPQEPVKTPIKETTKS